MQGVEKTTLLHILSYLPSMRDVLAIVLVSRGWYERLKDLLPVEQLKPQLIAIAAAVRYMPEFAGLLKRVAPVFSCGWDAPNLLPKFYSLPAGIGIYAKRIATFAEQRFGPDLKLLQQMSEQVLKLHDCTLPLLDGKTLIQRNRNRYVIDIINQTLVRRELDRLKYIHSARLFETYTNTHLPARVQLTAGDDNTLLADIQYKGEQGRYCFSFDIETKHWRCKELSAFNSVFDVSIEIIQPDRWIRTA